MWLTDRKHERSTQRKNPYSFGCTIGMLVGMSLITAHAQAQEMPPTPEPPVSSRLFPHPTGMNAYEDWVHAGDLIRDNKETDAALDAPLPYKRKLFNNPTIQHALTLLREGMNKPVVSPHVMVDENTSFAELASFRKLARLLYVEMYVQLADGRTDAAIDTFLLGLQFGHRIQTSTLINGLVGIAVQSIVIKGLTNHLNQLSEYQCQRVQRIVVDWMNWTSPRTSIMNAEKQFTIQMLERRRNDAKSLGDLLSASVPPPPQPDDEPNPFYDRQRKRIHSLLDYIMQQPAILGTLIDQAEERMRTNFDTAISNAQLPVLQRVPVPKESRIEGDGDFNILTPAEILAGELMPSMDQAMRSYDRLDAQMHILGSSAAIYTYKWNFSRLPNSLLDLHLGKLGIDPFTGNPLQYKRTGNSFELTSKGVPGLQN